MTTRQTSQADDTVATLQDAVRRGVPVMIPGAYVRRAAPPTPTPDWSGHVAAQPAVGASDRTRLEYAREGGGAPRERQSPQPATFLSRLRRTLLHPLDLLAIWRTPLPRVR